MIEETQQPNPRQTPGVITKDIQGRDELNLAEFPISALQWQQPRLGGATVNSMVYKSSRFDPATNEWVPQTVTLSSEEGLPTPADEQVLLAFLYLGKYDSNYVEPKVPFYLTQVIDVLKWSSNQQHYARLRGALRRLKALTIRYEKSWWDADGKQYEEEYATGIISSYKIARITRGRKKESEPPKCWIQWHPDFLRSLQAGNLKKLDLDILFQLRLPTSQRMYRFLDKRFFVSPVFDNDLVEFACGNIGLTPTKKTNELKRRLTPALTELERIGFIKKAPVAERYRKVYGGFWRIRLEKGQANVAIKSANSQNGSTTPETRLVREWHRLWSGAEDYAPAEADLRAAKAVLDKYEEVLVMEALPLLADRVREKWPNARTFSAVQFYIDEVIHEYMQFKNAAAARNAANESAFDKARKAEERQKARKEFFARWKPIWDELPATERERIQAKVLTQYPTFSQMPNVMLNYCLTQLWQEQQAETAGKIDQTPGEGQTEQFTNGA
jgi:hypothetical protein